MTRPGMIKRSLPVLVASAVSCATCHLSLGSSTTRSATQSAERRAGRKFRAKIPKLIAEARSAFADPEKSPEGKIGWLRTITHPTLFRELKPDVERLAQEDTSPEVRKSASDLLAFWHRMDAEKAAVEAQSEAHRRRAAMTPEQRRQADDAAKRERALANMEHYIELLKEGTAEQRRMMAGSASTWAEHLPEAWPILEQVVREDSEHSVRFYALSSLFTLLRDSERGMCLARSFLDKENNLGLRKIAATHLCCYGDRRGIPVLLELAASSKHPQSRARMLGTLLGTTRVNTPDVNPGGVLSRSFRRITEQDVPLLDQALKGWQRWWEREKDTFVFPRVRATQPSSRPARRR